VNRKTGLPPILDDFAVVMKLVLWSVLVGLIGCSVAKTEPNPEQQITFIYVHGFLENDDVPPFQAELNEFIAKWKLPAETQTYHWERIRLKPTMIVAQWNQSKQAVVAKTSDFTENVIDKFEEAKKPYVLIGYSLGTRLLASSLKEYEQPLKSLLGVYFLGSALPHNHQFADIDLPEGMKISSYHSSKFDSVLKFSFYHAEGIRAGGEMGFQDQLVTNHRTACSHIPFKTPIQRDYSSLAPSIVWQTYYRQNKLLSSNQDFKIGQVKLPAGSGNMHWNEIYREGDITIEKNTNGEIYRAVQADEKSKRSTIAWHHNMHDLLVQIGLFKVEAHKPDHQPN